MNVFKRAILSIKRRPGKSILLFLIIFLLSNVMAGALSVKQGTDRVEQTIMTRLGATYTIEFDYDKAQKDGMLNQQIQPPDEQLIRTIGQADEVRFYDYTFSTALNGKSIEAYLPDDLHENIQRYHNRNNPFQMQLYFKGINYAPVMRIEAGLDTLVEGRVFTQEEVDQGKNVVLMHRKLTEANGVKVGDTILLAQHEWDIKPGMPINNPKILSSKDLAAEVIGIYEVPSINTLFEDAADFNEMVQSMDIQNANTLYAPNRFLIDFNNAIIAEHSSLSEEEKAKTNIEIFTPYFMLKSPKDMADFEARHQPLLPDYYRLVGNSGNFDKVAGPLASTTKLADLILFATIGASILILTLVILLFLRDRKHELGIYLSLGEHKGKILSQILTEVLLIGLIAILISVFTGNMLASSLSESMVKNELLEAAESANPVKNANDYLGSYYRFGGLSGTVTQKDLAEQFEIKLTPRNFTLISALNLLTILLATVLPILYIVRLNPRKVLM